MTSKVNFLLLLFFVCETPRFTGNKCESSSCTSPSAIPIFHPVNTNCIYSNLHIFIRHSRTCIEEIRFSLPVYYNNVAICSLNIAVSQLALIRNDYETPAPECPDHFDPLPAPLAQRFDPSCYRPDGIFLRLTGEPYDQAMARLMFDKLRSDKNYIAHVLRVARDSFHQLGAHFKVLEELIYENRELEQEEHQFIVEYVRNLMMKQRLKNHLKNLSESIHQQRTVSQEFDV